MTEVIVEEPRLHRVCYKSQLFVLDSNIYSTPFSNTKGNITSVRRKDEQTKDNFVFPRGDLPKSLPSNFIVPLKTFQFHCPVNKYSCRRQLLYLFLSLLLGELWRNQGHSSLGGNHFNQLFLLIWLVLNPGYLKLYFVCLASVPLLGQADHAAGVRSRE